MQYERTHRGGGHTARYKLTLDSAVIPAVIAASVNAWWLWTAHWEHWSHMPPLEERTEYPYQNIRVKNYPWGDGDKTILYVGLFPLPFALCSRRASRAKATSRC